MDLSLPIRNSILATIFLLMASSGFSQLGKKEEETRFVTYRQAPALYLKNQAYILTANSAEVLYEQGSSPGEFIEAEMTAIMNHSWQIGDRVSKMPSDQDGKRVRLPKRDSKIKFLRNGETIYSKMNLSFFAIGEDGLQLSTDGMYEMQVLEGTWIDYENGGTLRLTISQKDAKRYSDDMASVYKNRQFLTWHATNFKARTIADLTKLANDPKGGEMAAALATRLPQLAQTNVVVTPVYESDAGVFTLEGETMTHTVKQSKISIQYKAFLPPAHPEAAESDSWRKRYNFIETRDFHLDSHGGNEEKALLDTLPTTYWPGW